MNQLDNEQIKIILKKALDNLYKAQPDLNEFSSETNQTEWNLAHHYANEIIKFFPGYSCDLDVIKRNLNNKRPDIIIHKRGVNTNNLLVIELKKNGRRNAIEFDIDKIKSDWFGEHLNYNYGAVVNCYTDDRNDQIVVFKNE